MDRYDIVDATFQPVKVRDVKLGAKGWIGRRCNWEAQWLIDEDDGGSYVGQWAMMPIIRPLERHPEFPYIWVPLCDLKIHGEMK